jgi:hypothetical protein
MCSDPAWFRHATTSRNVRHNRSKPLTFEAAKRSTWIAGTASTIDPRIEMLIEIGHLANNDT